MLLQAVHTKFGVDNIKLLTSKANKKCREEIFSRSDFSLRKYFRYRDKRVNQTLKKRVFQVIYLFFVIFVYLIFFSKNFLIYQKNLSFELQQLNFRLPELFLYAWILLDLVRFLHGSYQIL